MQSGGGAQQGGGGHGRNMVPGPPSSSASPSSSSSAVSTPHLGFDPMKHQQHQQQQQQRQSLQQQLLRNPEGREAILAYQSGIRQGVLGGGVASSSGSMHLQRVSQQQGQEEGQIMRQGFEQHMMNPIHQAYMQYALHAQQKSSPGMQAQQQMKMGMMGKDQELQMGNAKMQDLMSFQGANQAQIPSSKKPSDHFGLGGKQQVEEGHQTVSDHSQNQNKMQNQNQKHFALPTSFGQLVPGNSIRPMQTPQSQQTIHTMANSQVAMAAQLQAMQALALERNIDLSLPQNANLVAQLMPLMQSRMLGQQKVNESNTGPQSLPVSMSKQQVTSPQVANESSPRGNSSSDVSGHSGSTKARQTLSPGHVGGSTPNAMLVNNSSVSQGQQFPTHGRENQLPPRQPTINGSGMSSMPPPQSPANMNQGSDHLLLGKSMLSGSDSLQIQHARQHMNRSSPQSAASSNDNGLENALPSQKGQMPQAQPHPGFTKQQLHVLKAQILAFRRIKKGDRTLPRELLQAIAPPPLEVQSQQVAAPAGAVTHDRALGRNPMESNNKDIQAVILSGGMNNLKREVYEEKATAVSTVNAQGTSVIKGNPSVSLPAKEEQRNTAFPHKQEQEVEHGIQRTSQVSEGTTDKGKAVVSGPAVGSDTVQGRITAQSGNSPQAKDPGPSRKYHGPLFDFPFFTRKHDSFGSSMMLNNNNNLALAYDVKDLLVEEGIKVINKRRNENLKKIGGLLAVNLERKRIRPDLVLKLQIEEKKLRLQDVQARVRDEVDQQQQEIMAMPDRPYRKFVRLCERQRMELNRQVQAAQRAIREKQLKSIFQWRKKLLESHWAIRDARTSRNRGVAKYHEKMLREFSKKKDDDRNKRMEALKNNDVERYRQILLEQQTSVPGEAAERYEVLSSFLSQTEDYLNKLGGKITAAKNQQEVEDAANAASAAARAQGLSEEEVRAAASCAREEVLIRNRFSSMNAPQDSSSVSKYYTLAHAVSERVIRQPSMLRAGTLRDYQLVGLQWMLSLYNNKLNGILADEMGLGKTVQVMALIAYLMEFKSNYGPHLIIVPNAVLVNWKSELHNWLPSVSCIYYVGNKDQRTKLFSQEVCAMKFNVLVTTYEFIMYDKSKLSRVDWKYIVIDEAQRMKDRESVLARDLDKYRCQRRLLLTGTPLQNDLKELWSLLNLLLPEVFDNRKVFHDWFSQPFQKEVSHNAEDDWLETEKKVIVIHRLHQILEPFMLRRRVEDVEGSLPPKISIILRCKMSATQGSIYDWIKSTGTIRVDPEDEKRKVQKSPMYQAKTFKPLNNKCMELRKTCNHPLLNYPYFNDLSKDFLVRSCGKLWVLDRILIKLQRTGHRVLLFSTMTKLLDILEEYLQWRRLVYRRIDGTTSLEDRESAIVDFNSPDTDCFIFLLSIRAAGRGLNLQTADTVIIYDPDPNPKNEEQAVARAHRIGQTREVKVIYMEAVVDKVASHEKEDNFRNGGTVDSDDDLAGKDRYIGSIESLIRNNIQQYKIDMADEVINAGRFDQRTTHEERRSTLESLLRDEERYQETVHDVPSLQDVNRMIARSEEEVDLFDQMDEEFDWAEEMTRYDEVPKWLRASSREVNATVARMSKKPPKDILFTDNIGVEPSEMASDIPEKRRGRFKGKKFPNYAELDDDIEEFSEASSEELVNAEGEVGDSEDDETVGVNEVPTVDKGQSEDDLPPSTDRYEYNGTPDTARRNHMLQEAGSSGLSSGSRRLMPIAVPSISAQKFGSLSALDARPRSRSKRLHDDLEEGEIAMSGDSHFDLQQSGSLNHERDEGEDEQVLQPKIKRKRSVRVRPRHAVERLDEKSGDKSSLLRGDSSQSPFQAERRLHGKIQAEQKLVQEHTSYKHDQNNALLKAKRTPPTRKNSNKANAQIAAKPTRTNPISAPAEDAAEHSKESSDVKVKSGSGLFGGPAMTEAIQRRCKNVITKIQRRIDKEGQQIIPLLTDLWKRTESPGSSAGNSLLDLRKIELRVDRLEYNGVMDLIADVQVMLKGGMQYFGFSHEVRSEARKVHDLFFDIMKIAFPDTDFREARSALTFSGSIASSASLSSPRPIGQTKRPKPTIDIEPEPSLPSRPLSRGSIPAKETRFGTRVAPVAQEPRPFTHPGDFVICKKKRKDREKSGVVKAAGPVSPVGRGTRSPGQTRLSQSQTIGQAGGGVGWANPVKRMRTDAGKRRPSQV
ncbi:ATP-dependent helicase BRM-like [Cynara cardunculus var. scolymus]|uniref:ATP-dependent helicase BRM-like n=1 Tax=Cynara cardunculus var. scolymus TaxID=59895 RepID=UPI000D62A68B|nr:ATP-dependent helicase BRM-like [Cynara cardunculus var. scolymus]